MHVSACMNAELRKINLTVFQRLKTLYKGKYRTGNQNIRLSTSALIWIYVNCTHG